MSVDVLHSSSISPGDRCLGMPTEVKTDRSPALAKSITELLPLVPLCVNLQ